MSKVWKAVREMVRDLPQALATTWCHRDPGGKIKPILLWHITELYLERQKSRSICYNNTQSSCWKTNQLYFIDNTTSWSPNSTYLHFDWINIQRKKTKQGNLLQPNQAEANDEHFTALAMLWNVQQCRDCCVRNVSHNRTIQQKIASALSQHQIGLAEKLPDQTSSSDFCSSILNLAPWGSK